ncbi:DUF3500 domain-containing protein [Devosia sp. SL43]|uniref:DUF3500 domain-containing protein n=1 Tax=Devosia sp. SL43 TaxID=2806348 RepID=UPI001F442EAC|nr:DUF3500 domain-containing protein [Devosia sp. SL43]UJW85098.1 DUF3500 domain-containing protein [Devosia sp. SL43]
MAMTHIGRCQRSWSFHATQRTCVERYRGLPCTSHRACRFHRLWLLQIEVPLQQWDQDVMIARAAMVFALGLAFTTSNPVLVLGQDATATLNEDGSVATTGIAQPGQDVQISEECQAEPSQVEIVLCTANAFLVTLSDEQRSAVVLPMTEENSTAWSNLPCGSNCRVGVQLSDLSGEQVSAALAVIKAATSDYGDDGYDELTQVTMADDILNASQASGAGGPGSGTPPGEQPPDGAATPTDAGAAGAPPAGGGGGYSSTTYFIAFLGEPSASETWQLQFGGHHLALLKTYRGNVEVGDTPAFIGVEPKVWTSGDSIYGPLEDDRAAMVAMLAGLSEDQLAAAKLDTAFSDVVLGPGADGQFPSTKVGLRVAELDDAQRQLVLAAIAEWVRDTAASTADAIMADYQAELDETYIAFSGNATLANHADYVRIDGPRVWIEFVCQDGVIYSSQIHYHTIWRDHETDYGAIYSF